MSNVETYGKGMGGSWRYHNIVTVIITKGAEATYHDAVEVIGKNAPFTEKSFNNIKARIMRMPKKYGIPMKIVKGRN